MATVSKRIIEHAAQLPEGAPLCAKELLHLGSRAAVDQALSRLAGRGKLMRLSRGMYVRPIEGRFGVRAPSTSKVVEGYASLMGETIASHGAAAANALGLTTQVPARMVYLTSGPSRKLTVGSQTVELRHAPRSQLALSGSPAGSVIRALTWLGPSHASEALRKIKSKLTEAEFREIALARRFVPTWMAKEISEIVVNG